MGRDGGYSARMVALDGKPMITIAIADQNRRVDAINFSAGIVQAGQEVLFVISPVRDRSARWGNENKEKNSRLCEEKADGYS